MYALATPAMHQQRATHPLLQITWWMALASLLLFVMNRQFGAVAVGGFLLIWIAYAGAWPMRSLNWLCSLVVPWALPALALASVLWSEDRAISERAALEFIACTAASMMITRALSARDFLSAFMGAMVMACIFSYVNGRTEFETGTGDVLAGLFGSKNELAYSSGLCMLASLGVAVSRQQKLVMRLGGAFGAVLGPLIIVKTHSVGAAASISGAVAVFAACTFARSVPARWRGTMVAAGFALAIALGGVVWDYANNRQGSLLSVVGKSSTLTGRTYLWEHARIAIDKKPIQGVGYQAFWVIGSDEAEGLWHYAHEKAGPGFHFHNLFYETTVELGWVGALVLGGTFLAALINTLVWQLRYPDPQSAFFLALLSYFLLRMPIEVDLLFPFAFGTVLLPISYVFARAGKRGEAAGRAPQRGAMPARRPLLAHGTQSPRAL